MCRCNASAYVAATTTTLTLPVNAIEHYTICYRREGLLIYTNLTLFYYNSISLITNGKRVYDVGTCALYNYNI